jgi:hypothetical protein
MIWLPPLFHKSFKTRWREGAETAQQDVVMVDQKKLSHGKKHTSQ